MLRYRQVTLGTVALEESDIRRVVGTLRKGILSPGPITRRFEKLNACIHRMPDGVYVNSGQSALQLALEVIKLRIGKPPYPPVYVPAVTYISSLHAVWNAGLEVRLVDIDVRNGLMLDPPKDAKIVMPVHLFGKARIPTAWWPNPESNDFDGYVVEDGCEALGNPDTGYGDFLCHSFYVAHTITTGVGGMVLTRRRDDANMIRRLANHGRARPQDMYAGLRVSKSDHKARFRFEHVGFSYKLGDMNAALGIGQLQRLSKIISHRRSVAHYLTTLLEEYNFILPSGTTHTYMMYPIVCREKGDKARLVKALNRWGVETRDAMPITNQPIVRQALGRDLDKRFPYAAWFNDRAFYVGIHQRTTNTDMEHVAEVIKSVLG